MKIKQYIEENDKGDVSPAVLWDACKAVLRGKIIAETALGNTLRKIKFTELQSKLKELKWVHKSMQT